MNLIVAAVADEPTSGPAAGPQSLLPGVPAMQPALGPGGIPVWAFAGSAALASTPLPKPQSAAGQDLNAFHRALLGDGDGAAPAPKAGVPGQLAEFFALSRRRWSREEDPAETQSLSDGQPPLVSAPATPPVPGLQGMRIAEAAPGDLSPLRPAVKSTVMPRVDQDAAVPVTVPIPQPRTVPSLDYEEALNVVAGAPQAQPQMRSAVQHRGVAVAVGDRVLDGVANPALKSTASPLVHPQAAAPVTEPLPQPAVVVSLQPAAVSLLHREPGAPVVAGAPVAQPPVRADLPQGGVAVATEDPSLGEVSKPMVPSPTRWPTSNVRSGVGAEDLNHDDRVQRSTDALEPNNLWAAASSAVAGTKAERPEPQGRVDLVALQQVVSEVRRTLASRDLQALDAGRSIMVQLPSGAGPVAQLELQGDGQGGLARITLVTTSAEAGVQLVRDLHHRPLSLETVALDWRVAVRADTGAIAPLSADPTARMSTDAGAGQSGFGSQSRGHQGSGQPDADDVIQALAREQRRGWSGLDDAAQAALAFERRVLVGE